MKKLIGTAILMALLSVSVFAQRPGNDACQDKDGWLQRMKSEKIAFLTAELDLSPEEAQVFWPVYNAAQNEDFASTNKLRDAFETLEKAVASNADDKEIEKLISAYLEAEATKVEIAEKYLPKYKKVLSPSKVARLYLAEEKFRRTQIHRLRGARHEAGAEMRKPHQDYPGIPEAGCTKP